VHRLIHAGIGAAVIALIALAWVSKNIEPGAAKLPLIYAHIILGYCLVVGLIARMVWGFIGPKHARFSGLWHLPAWISLARGSTPVRADAFGHDPFASIAYIILYACLGVSIVTGLLIAGIKRDMGPLAPFLFDNFSLYELSMAIHETVLYVVTGFSIVHILGMIKHESKHGYPVVQAMVSGYQYRPMKQGRGNYEEGD
jgi:cytochrome b